MNGKIKNSETAMSDRNGKPLLTFALVSCNQEQFVREAVEAAFAQTYSPLEIILSDDCSDDRSFEIMSQMARLYRGRHRVVLNRNPVRKQTGGHFNRVAELANGELIVIAAADDVSLPHRTQTIFDAWDRAGRGATSIYSEFIQIDGNGRVIEQIYRGEELCGKGQSIEQTVEPLAYVQTLKPTVHGCAHIISPRLFTLFDKMLESVIYEDKVLAFRSVLAGKFLYVNEPLVKWRLHGANIDKYLKSGKGGTDLKGLERQESRFQRKLHDSETMYGAFLLDLETARQREVISVATFEKVARETERRRKRFSLISKYLESGIFRKSRILRELRRIGLDKEESRILSRRLLPRPALLWLRLVRNYAVLAWDRTRR